MFPMVWVGPERSTQASNEGSAGGNAATVRAQSEALQQRSQPGDAGPSDNPWLRKGVILENASKQKDQGALRNEEA